MTRKPAARSPNSVADTNRIRVGKQLGRFLVRVPGRAPTMKRQLHLAIAAGVDPAASPNQNNRTNRKSNLKSMTNGRFLVVPAVVLFLDVLLVLSAARRRQRRRKTVQRIENDFLCANSVPCLVSESETIARAFPHFRRPRLFFSRFCPQRSFGEFSLFFRTDTRAQNLKNSPCRFRRKKK